MCSKTAHNYQLSYLLSGTKDKRNKLNHYENKIVYIGTCLIINQNILLILLCEI